jgi:hypothetical protein
MFKRLLRVLGWIVTIAGIAISLLAAWGLGYAIIVPDTSGSPDARGMLLGSSLVVLLVGGLPTLVVGAALLAFGRAPGNVVPGESI